MFDRIRARRFQRDRDGDPADQGGRVATAERTDPRVGNGYPDDDAPDGNGGGTTSATRVRTRDRAPARAGTGAAAAGTAAAAERAHLRARDEFGGINWGSAFFGWLVAMGLGTILVAIAYAAGAAIGLTKGSAGTVDIVGGAVLIAIFALSYFCGGYVAGRMSRFDGFRQGLATWIVGLVLTAALAAAGAIWGQKYDVLGALHIPRIPVDEGAIATGGAIALAGALVASLIFAVLGGKAGERYHRRVDRMFVRNW
jgi:hypothetical protein